MLGSTLNRSLAVSLDYGDEKLRADIFRTGSTLCGRPGADRISLGHSRPSQCAKDRALARWYQARTADRRAGTRKTMIVALARKLLIALWRFVTTDETLEGDVLPPAA